MKKNDLLYYSSLKTRAEKRYSGAKNYNTLYSHVVPHHSTDKAITGLTAEIRRDPVLFRLYGRSSRINLGD